VPGGHQPRQPIPEGVADNGRWSQTKGFDHGGGIVGEVAHGDFLQ
jgi:hypothetical protein